MKRPALAIILVALLTLLLVACGDTTPTDTAMSISTAVLAPAGTQPPADQTRLAKGNLTTPTPVPPATPLPQITPTAGATPAFQATGMDYATLLAALVKSGAKAEAGANIPQDSTTIFTGKARTMIVNGENVTVYEYADSATAAAEARGVSGNGAAIQIGGRAVNIDWVTPPHFYTSGRLIVLYVGDHVDVMDALSAVLGQQFQGWPRSKPTTQPAAHTAKPATPSARVTDYAGLLAALRAYGASVQPSTETLNSMLFTGKGQSLMLDGERIQVFEYASMAAADAEAGRISPDGSTVRQAGQTGQAIVDWIATPHFYKAGRLLVVYVGDNEKVTRTLSAVLGIQFAGGQTSALTATPNT